MIAQAFQWDFRKPYWYLSCFQVKIFSFFPVFRLMLLSIIFLAYIWSGFLEDTCKILLRVLRLEVIMEFWISELTFEKDWKLRDRIWQTVWWEGNGIWEGDERTEHALEMWRWLIWWMTYVGNYEEEMDSKWYVWMKHPRTRRLWKHCTW